MRTLLRNVIPERADFVLLGNATKKKMETAGDGAKLEHPTGSTYTGPLKNGRYVLGYHRLAHSRSLHLSLAEPDSLKVWPTIDTLGYSIYGSTACSFHCVLCKL